MENFLMKHDGGWKQIAWNLQKLLLDKESVDSM